MIPGHYWRGLRKSMKHTINLVWSYLNSFQTTRKPHSLKWFMPYYSIGVTDIIQTIGHNSENIAQKLVLVFVLRTSLGVPNFNLIG